jgi:hypothetical protein
MNRDGRGRLDDAQLYEREILRLAARRANEPWHADRVHFSLERMAANASEVARRLAVEVSSGAFEFQPLEPYVALIGGKERTIYRLDPIDSVVWAAIVRVMMRAIEPQLGEHLHSYRTGRSQWTATRALLAYLRAHTRQRPDPKTRGVYVLRRDVKRYDENIPVGNDSMFWKTLEALVGDERFGYRGDFHALVRKAFRPVVLQDGAERVLERGIPTGIPTQTIACNTYLLPLDRKLCAIEGSFYARFGDDLVFAHPDARTTEAAARVMDEELAALELGWNTQKQKAMWLTRAGRPSEEPGFAAVSRFEYLGLDVGFDGARLRRDKRRALWRGLCARLEHTDRLLVGCDMRERADALCAVVRSAYDAASLSADRYAGWLTFDVMSLEDLRQLDHHVALAIAERLSQRRGPRAFRSYPKRALHTQHGLPSLTYAFVQKRAAHRPRSKA